MEPVRVVTVAPERVAGWIGRFELLHGEVAVTVVPDGTSVHLAAPDGAGAEITVPFPPLVLETDPLEALTAHLVRPRTLGVLLVRRGGFAAGVFRGRDLADSKVGTPYVQGRTKAGGWSQQRYARRRSAQAEQAYADAADAAARVLLPARADLEAIITGGDRAGVAAVLNDPRLVPLGALVSAEPFLAVPDPRLRVLLASLADALAVRIALNDRA